MADRKTMLAKAYFYRWFGLKGFTAKESLLGYGIAAKCKNFKDFEYVCYAPDPDDDNFCIRFVISEIQLIQAVRAQKDLAEFLLEFGFFFDDFAQMIITNKLYYVCQRYDVIALLFLNNPPKYLRTKINLV
ncbi:hypothetical protein [Xylanibacter ruminicola]|uniref:hypothetical protein n=1 Tax=Xylanibacter ruminicola TaxID=839 RepID=UPI00048CFD92|nr:hypothetical protein [Xylanibacter ruminicola]